MFYLYLIFYHIHYTSLILYITIIMFKKYVKNIFNIELEQIILHVLKNIVTMCTKKF